MKELLCEIWVCLLIAFLLGLLVGWLLKCLCCRKKIEQLNAEHKQEIEKLQADYKTAPTPVQAVQEIKTEQVSVASVAPALLMTQAPDEKDDLKRISGIGPVFEGVLNSLGIYKFEQIAALDEENIQWVAEHIDTFPDRIFTDRWVEQAAEFAKESTES